MFHTSLHICLDPGIFHVLFYFRHNGLDVLFADALLICNLSHQIIIDFRLQIFQCQVIQLNLYFGNTKTLGNGRINVHSLPRLFLLLLRTHIFQRSHVVQTVGQLDQNNTDILRHGQEHLTEILCLLIHLVCGIAQLTQLGNAIYQKRHLIAELPCHILGGHGGILHHIMKKARCNTFLIKLQICQNNTNAKRMNDIRFSGFTDLIFMGGLRHLICFFNHGKICGRMIFLHTFYQFLIQLIGTGKIFHLLDTSVILLNFPCLFFRHISITASLSKSQISVTVLKLFSFLRSRLRFLHHTFSVCLFPSGLQAPSGK